MIRNNTSIITKFLSIVIFITNITQLPQLIATGYNSKITLIVWGMALFYLLSQRVFCLNLWCLNGVFCAGALVIISLFFELFSNQNYMSIGLLYPFMLSVFVFCIGGMYSFFRDEIEMSSLYISYIFSGFIVAVGVYYNSFASGFSWTSRTYAYASKNSVSQILLSVIVLLLFADLKDRIPQFLRVIGTVFLIMLLLMLKSRASLIGIVIIIFYILLNKNILLRYKVALLVIIAFFTGIIMTNTIAYDVFVNGIIFAGRSSSNLNDVSSGRYGMLQNFISIFPDNWIIGVGNYNITENMESFPLAVLIQYGVIGCIPIVVFLLLPFKIIRKIKNNNSKRVLIVLVLCYYMNGLFEELAPLGPGVKCYLLWFLLGIQSFAVYWTESRMGDFDDY